MLSNGAILNDREWLGKTFSDMERRVASVWQLRFLLGLTWLWTWCSSSLAAVLGSDGCDGLLLHSAHSAYTGRWQSSRVLRPDENQQQEGKRFIFWFYYWLRCCLRVTDVSINGCLDGCHQTFFKLLLLLQLLSDSYKTCHTRSVCPYWKKLRNRFSKFCFKNFCQILNRDLHYRPA